MLKQIPHDDTIYYRDHVGLSVDLLEGASGTSMYSDDELVSTGSE